jgi:cystathionine beta-lyase
MEAPLSLTSFDDLSLERLRARRSAKWATHPPDVLPAWVAEMDFRLAPPVREALLEAVERDDCGYPEPRELVGAFVAFAAEHFGWTVEPERLWIVPDVMSAIGSLLGTLTEPNAAVVVNPPIYPPFFGAITELDRRLVEVPLARDGARWILDLDALERAFADGAAAYLLCNPHNPTGRVFGRSELDTVARLADRHGVLVFSDEIHAPLTLPGATFTPYVALGDPAAAHGVTITSASKTWNIAGLKCAVAVAGSDTMGELLTQRLPVSLRHRAGHLGVIASVAAFSRGRPWLAGLLARLDANRRLLGELLERDLPAISYAEPEAGYLAWLDCRELGLGDDPAAVFLERGKVALSPGPPFGGEGKGFARLNFGTSSGLLEEAVRRMTHAVSAL